MSSPEISAEQAPLEAFATRIEIATSAEERHQIAEDMREYAMSLGDRPWEIDDNDIQEGDK